MYLLYIYHKSFLLIHVLGCRIGRIKVIFCLPKATTDRNLKIQSSSIPLAYIEWYSKLTRPEKNHGMYKIHRLDPTEAAVVPLSNIHQGCMLFPDFSKGVPKEWKSKNVLDQACTFFLNNWQSKYTYQMIY